MPPRHESLEEDEKDEIWTFPSSFDAFILIMRATIENNRHISKSFKLFGLVKTQSLGFDCVEKNLTSVAVYLHTHTCFAIY